MSADQIPSRELLLDILRAEGTLFDPTPSRSKPPERNVVYYIRWGGRIKIGTTKRLAQRLASLYYDDLLAAEPGSFALEKRRHQQFSEYRVAGQREWFHESPALLFHANTLRDKHPELIRSMRQHPEEDRRG